VKRRKGCVMTWLSLGTAHPVAAKRTVVRRLAFILLAALVAAPSQGAEQPPLLKDLTATLAVLNLPCGQVTSARRNGVEDRDHLVTCRDGNRYRIFVDSNDRVVARKL
jgi:hypothetical protein